MPDLNCNANLRELMRSVVTFQNRQSLVEYINSLASMPNWDLLLRTFPELREKYRQSLVALHKELLPNYMSAQDIYYKLWALFKEITLNANQYVTRESLKQKLSEFCSEVKKPLTTYDIIYEIKNFDVGEGNFTFGNVEIFKLKAEYLVKIGLLKDTSVVKNTMFNEWVGKSVAKTEVSISDLSRAYESGLKIVSDVLDTVRLVAFWGRLDTPVDDLFLWELGQSMTIPKVVQHEGIGVGTTYHRGFRPSITPMDGAIRKALYEQKSWERLFDGTLPDDINIRINRAIKWMSQAITSSNLDFKIVYLCTALEILLLPGHKDGTKGELVALRQVLLGRGHSYAPGVVLHLYQKRSSIIHSGTLEITSYPAYWNLLVCCFEVLRNIINLSKQNPSVKKLTDLLKIVENSETLQDFIHNCELGIYDGEGVNKVKKAAESRLKQIKEPK